MGKTFVEFDEFIKHCKYEKNLSSKTIKAYSSDLAQFKEFILKRDYLVNTSQISKFEIKEYLEKISNLKPKSINRKIATLKATFNFLEYEDKISINPFRKIRIRIQQAKRLPMFMDINEIKEILRCIYQNKNSIHDINSFKYSESLRNTVIIELLFATGARVSEIANLKLENINIETGTVSIIGKGNKERIIQICNKEILTLLKTYISHFHNKILKSDGYLLINRLGNKMSDQSIRGLVKNASNNANIQKHITPHVFRHTLATLLLENDVDIKYIQSILGHSSIMTTQIYTHVNREKQRQIIETKHPREYLKISAL